VSSLDTATVLLHITGLRNESHLDSAAAASRQPSVAGHGALQGSSYIGGYSSSGSPATKTGTRSANGPPPYQSVMTSSTAWAQPYSDQNSSGSAESQGAEFQPEVPWEFPREKLYIRQKIGEGSFGEVWRARVDGILGRVGEQLVAVKMLHGSLHRFLVTII